MVLGFRAPDVWLRTNAGFHHAYIGLCFCLPSCPALPPIPVLLVPPPTTYTPASPIFSARTPSLWHVPPPPRSPRHFFLPPCPRLSCRIAEDDTGRRRDRTFGGRHKLCWRSVRPSLSPTLLALIRCSKPPRSQFFYGPFRSDEPVLGGLYQHALLTVCSCRETLINIDQEVKHIWSCATFFSFPVNEHALNLTCRRPNGAWLKWTYIFIRYFALAALT